MMHFCWLPPERLRMPASGPSVFTPRRSIDSFTSLRSRPTESSPPETASASVHIETFSRTVIWSKSPSRLRSSVTRAMPARVASAGCRKATGFPSSLIVPVGECGLVPNRHSSSSVRPAPISPAMPSTSPRRNSNEMSSSRHSRAWPGQGRCNLSTARTTSPGVRPSARSSSSISRPTMACVMPFGSVSSRSNVPTCRPSRRTVILSLRRKTSSILWEM